MEETAHNSRKGPAQCRRHQNDAGSGAVRGSAAAVTRAGHRSGPKDGLRPDIAAVLKGWLRLRRGDVASMVSPNLHRPLRSSKRHRNIPAGNRGGCAEHSSTTAPLSWPPSLIRNVHHSNRCDLRRGMSQVLLRINVGPCRYIVYTYALIERNVCTLPMALSLALPVSHKLSFSLARAL